MNSCLCVSLFCVCFIALPVMSCICKFSVKQAENTCGLMCANSILLFSFRTPWLSWNRAAFPNHRQRRRPFRGKAFGLSGGVARSLPVAGLRRPEMMEVTVARRPSWPCSRWNHQR